MPRMLLVRSLRRGLMVHRYKKAIVSRILGAMRRARDVYAKVAAYLLAQGLPLERLQETLLRPAEASAAFL